MVVKLQDYKYFAGRLNLINQWSFDKQVGPHMAPPFGSREDCDYARCYCEENVYRLCEKVPVTERSRFFAVFISNSDRCVPLFSQIASGERPFVLWDYHVVMLEQQDGKNAQIWDLDTRLPFPSSFDDYWIGSIQPKDWNIPPQYGRCFRVIPCADYLTYFSSDRSHMKAENGEWIAPPPNWEPILKNGLNNINNFISMDPNVLSDISVVLDENDMNKRFSGN
ncbi:Glutamine amidohydrolase [Trichostrongylus colubriformis]|uniref:Protein N-terminal glutamine amidohydrolase n=1 Tax=Trichostrongylus colubriformis TaxID=6319 RepID=A0AAN8IN51_TRICO